MSLFSEPEKGSGKQSDLDLSGLAQRIKEYQHDPAHKNLRSRLKVVQNYMGSTGDPAA